jgi:hypothetical protein
MLCDLQQIVLERERLIRRKYEITFAVLYLTNISLAFTDEGPVCNYYDASSPDGKVPALIGLIGGRDALYWNQRSQGERKSAVISQLVKIFGPEAAKPLDYIDKDWTSDQWQRGGKYKLDSRIFLEDDDYRIYNITDY